MTSRSPESLPAADPELAALTALYVRHAPDLFGPLGGNGGELEVAARSHLALAEHRAPECAVADNLGTVAAVPV